MKHKFKLSVIFLVTVYVLCMMFPLASNGAETKKIRIPCGMNDLLRLDENGEPYGHFYDYMSKLAEINNWEYEYVETSWTDAVKMLDNGQLDILLPTNYSAERDETMDFSEMNAGYTAAGLFALAESNYNYEDFDSWDGVKIAVSRNSSNEVELIQFAKDKGFSFTPVYISEMDKKIAALKSGDADMIIFSASNNVPEANLVALLDASPFYFTVKEGNSSLMAEINNGMKKIVSRYPELVSDTNKHCLTGNNTAVMALTAEERELVEMEKEVSVGFYVDTEPLAYIDDDGSYKGVYPELIKYLNENTKLKINLVPLTRDKKWRDYLFNGDIDFYIGASAPVVATDDELRATDTFIDYMTILVTNKDCNFPYIEKPTIALTNGRAYWVDHMPDSISNANIKFYTSAKDCLSAVAKGDADGTLLNNYEYNYYSKNARFSSLITWENYRFSAMGGLTASAHIDPVLFSTVNKSLSALTADKVNEIVSQSLNMPYRANLSDDIYASRYALAIFTIIAIVTVFVSLFVIYYRNKQRIAFEQAQEKERESLKVMAALSQDYEVIYFTDLDTDTCRLIRASENREHEASIFTKHSLSMYEYVLKRVMPEYRLALIKLADPTEIIYRFKDEKDFSVRYRVIPDENQVDFYEMHFVDAGETDGDHFMVFGIRCVDEIAKDEFKQRQLLRDALEIAERASSAKTDFLSKMSHDMRTPLNAVIGMTAIAENHLNEPERIHDALNKISASGKHLLGLVNEVLDMSKIESGKLSLNEEDFNLAAMLDELITMIQPQVDKRHHKLKTDLSGLEHTQVTGDCMRLQQIFMNILGNSVKYTKDGGQLSMTVSEKLSSSSKASVYTFVFTDNGIGMSEEFLERIFEPFSRAEDPRISKIQGTGLGMSIANNIIRMMNGTLTVKSKLGEGSEFTVTVPLKLADVSDELIDDISENKLNVFSEEDFSGKRVLIAEDNELNMEIACEILGMAGLEIEQAENGRIAAEMFANSTPGHYDLIFMDLQMPEMNGHEASKAIRSCGHPDALTVPIVAMTANAFNDDVKASKDAGMNDHLSKPLDFAKLNGVLKKYLS